VTPNYESKMFGVQSMFGNKTIVAVPGIRNQILENVSEQ
jgi:hypothetical protein